VEDIRTIGWLSLKELNPLRVGSVKGVGLIIPRKTVGFLLFTILIRINQIVKIQIWWRYVKNVIYLFRRVRMILTRSFFLEIRFVPGIISFVRRSLKSKKKGGEKKWLK